MSLAFSHDQIVSAPAATRKTAIRKTAIDRTAIRKAAVDLAFFLAFVAFAIVSILVVATHASSPETESAVAAFAQL